MLTATKVATTTQSTALPGPSFNSSPYFILILVIITASMLFFSNKSQKKREREAIKLRNNVEVGDEVTTIGGIVGIVTNIKDDVLTLETGSDRSKIRIAKWAIQTNITASQRLAEKKQK